MGRVRSSDTQPELFVRRALYAAGLRYRLHPKDVPGRPDVVFRARQIALFVHGCFWHRHPGCKATRTPKSRVTFWKAKFAENVARDRRVVKALTAAGWRVIVLWECEARDAARVAEVVAEIAQVPSNRFPAMQDAR